MKTETKIYAALAVLALFVGGFYMTKKSNAKQQSEHSATAASADLPNFAPTKDDVEKITKIEITTPKKDDKEKLTVVLEKRDADWEVTSPVKAKANASNVRSTLDNLKELKAKDSIDHTSATYGQYDLNDDKAVHVVAYKGADKAVDLYFGKSGSRGQMARVAGKDGVFIAGGYSSYLYGRELKNWRETSILKFEDANVIQADIANKNGKFSFSKNGDKWSGSYTKADKDGKLEKSAEKEWKKFDESKVKAMLGTYKALNAEDFADEKADTGLDKAQSEGGIVRIKLKDNAGDYVIKVGKTQKGTSRFASKDGDPTLFVLSSWTSDWATAKRDKFEKDEKKDKEKEKDKPSLSAMPPGGDDDE